MITEKQKIRNSIIIRRKLIDVTHQFLELLKSPTDDKIINESINFIVKQKTAILAYETRLGVLVEKGKF